MSRPNSKDLPAKQPKEKLVPAELQRSDVTVHPTYSKSGLAYHAVCRRRYHHAGMAQRQQLLNELGTFEHLQPIALSSVRVHRVFSNGLLSHRLPTKRIPDVIIPDPLTPAERSRVEDILAGKVNFAHK